MGGKHKMNVEDLSGCGEPESDLSLQNQAVQCLALLATSGASTHRVEQIGESLFQRIGWQDVQVSLFPSLLTVTFNGHSDILVTRTITHRLGRRFSIARMEEMDAMLEKVVQGVLPPA